MYNSFIEQWFSNFAAQFNQIKITKNPDVHVSIKSGPLGMDPRHYIFINSSVNSNVNLSLTISVIHK